MKGQIERDGTVTITYNNQAEQLIAPGEKQIYLPCESCGALQIVDYNVVAITCPECEKKQNPYSLQSLIKDLRGMADGQEDGLGNLLETAAKVVEKMIELQRVSSQAISLFEVADEDEATKYAAITQSFSKIMDACDEVAVDEETYDYPVRT